MGHGDTAAGPHGLLPMEGIDADPQGPRASGETGLLTEERPDAGEVPSGLVAGLRAFAADHNGAKAVIEYVGRRGARIVLIGGDGAWGDQVAPGTDVARQACATAGVPVENSWEQELISQMRPSNNLWRSMGRRTMAR
jgi:hypothetical protein